MALPRPARLGFVVSMVLALAATSACTVVSEVSESGRCQVDSDCAGSQRCFQRRFCIHSSLHEHPVVMRVSPGPSSGLVEEHFAAQVGGEMPAATNWQLTTPARVRGTVKLGTKGRGLSEFIPGTLIATAPGLVDGTWLRYTTASVLNPSKPAGETTDFTQYVFDLRVQPGHTYNVAFWPESADLAPRYERVMIGGDIDALAIKLPVAPDVIRVAGRIVSRPKSAACDAVSGPASATPCGADCTAIPTLRVALVDDDGRQRSSAAVTDADGRFEVAVEAAAGKVHLDFSPTINKLDPDQANDESDKLAASLPSGTWTQPIDIAALHKEAVIKHDLGELDLGPLPANHLLVREIRGDHGLTLAGVRVRVIRPLTSPKRCVKSGDNGGSGWQAVDSISDFRSVRSAVSDGTGGIKVQVFSGTGIIAVAPPANTSSGAWSKQVELAATADPIRCPSRRKVHGVVQYLNKPVANAKVTIQPLPAAAGVVLGDTSLAPIFVTADDQGRFAAWLDPGRYAMIVRPPSQIGLARTLADVIEVKAPSKADTAPHDIELNALSPTVLHGRILGTKGKPQAGVLIDVLAKSSLRVSDKELQAAARRIDAVQVMMQTHLLGSAVTDADGRFEILVAPGNLASAKP